MKKIAVALIMLSSFSYAQMRTNIDAFDNQRGRTFDVEKTIKTYQGIEGNPYFTEEFLPVVVEGYSKAVPNLRYNIYEDEMEFMVNNTINYVVKEAGEMKIKFPTLGNKTYLLSQYTLDGNTKTGFLVELVNSKKLGLYKKEKIQVIENKNSTTNTYLKAKNPYFEKDNDMYLIKKGDNFIKFPKNIKELKTILSEEAQKIEEFNKKKKINFKKEQDLVSLFEMLKA